MSALLVTVLEDQHQVGEFESTFLAGADGFLVKGARSAAEIVGALEHLTSNGWAADLTVISSHGNKHGNLMSIHGSVNPAPKAEASKESICAVSVVEVLDAATSPYIFISACNVGLAEVDFSRPHQMVIVLNVDVYVIPMAEAAVKIHRIIESAMAGSGRVEEQVATCLRGYVQKSRDFSIYPPTEGFLPAAA